jgi:hypothetical protein
MFNIKPKVISRKKMIAMFEDELFESKLGAKYEDSQDYHRSVPQEQPLVD